MRLYERWNGFAKSSGHGLTADGSTYPPRSPLALGTILMTMNQRVGRDPSQPLHVQNLMTGTVNGPLIQAGSINGDVRVNMPEQAGPSLSIELIAGYGDGFREYMVLPYADSKGIRCEGGHVCLGVTVTNSGLIGAEISSAEIDVRRVSDAEESYSRLPITYWPGRGTGPLPYRLANHAAATWLADLPKFGENLRAIYGEVPWLDLTIRARAHAAAVGPITGDWHPLRR